MASKGETATARSFTVRSMRVDEVGRVKELVHALQHYQQMKRCPRLPTEQQLYDELTHEDPHTGTRLPNNNGTYVIVAVDNMRVSEPEHKCIVGYMIYTQAFSPIQGRKFYMTSFFIEESYRRHKLGTKMIEHLKAHGRSMGIYSFDVPFMNDNVIGQKFYAKLGARLVSHEYVTKALRLE